MRTAIKVALVSISGADHQLITVVTSIYRSGLIGLAWPALAQSGANPFWLNLVESSGTLANPLFAFSLARFVDDNSATENEANGGSMDIGFTNADHFSGSINYVSLVDESYWLVPLDAIAIDGTTSNPGGNAAIDT